MSDLPVYNQTGTDLPHWILAQIKAEMIEYFGESIHAIRIQTGIQRHAYNAKTHEVRYAFFLSDFDFEAPRHSGPQLDSSQFHPEPPVLADETSDQIDIDDEIEFEDDDEYIAILDDDVFEDIDSDPVELQALIKDRESDDESDLTFA